MPISRRVFLLSASAIPVAFYLTGKTPKPEKPKAEIPKEIDLTEVEAVTPVKLKELSNDEIQVLSDIESFLKTYTKNGIYNFGSIPRFLEGLRSDNDGIIAAAEESEKEYANDYVNGKLDFATRMIVVYEINRKGEEQIGAFLKDIGVDPKTKDLPDEKDSIDNYVTREILLEVEGRIRKLKAIIERDQLPGTKVKFPGGITLDLVKAVKESKTAVPEGVEIISPELVAKP